MVSDCCAGVRLTYMVIIDDFGVVLRRFEVRVLRSQRMRNESTHRRLWERRADEPDNAFGAFQRYRDMTTRTGPIAGQRRTTTKLHALTEGEPDRWARDTLRMWCKDYEWRARAAAYDFHLDRLALDTTEKTVREMHQRHVRLAMRLQDIAGTELEKLAHKAREAAKRLKDVGTGDLVRFAEQGVKLERLARGESTETVEGRLDLSRLSLEDLKALKALRDKAKLTE